MSYRVTCYVEINGTARIPDEVLSESDFRAASGRMIPQFDENGEQIGETPELSELESLLGTGHIEEV